VDDELLANVTRIPTTRPSTSEPLPTWIMLWPQSWTRMVPEDQVPAS